jgi:uncharacterized protein (TIGR00255 family)
VRLEGAPLPPLELDIERARGAYEALARLRDELAPGTDLPLSVLAGFPDLIVASGGPDPAPLRAALETAVDAALERLDQMRAVEGAALGTELASRLRQARELLARISERAPDLARVQKDRLLQRLERLTRGSEGLDPSRIATEVALLADRSDVTEELVRLGSHLDQFDELLDGSGPSGRKMDFLLQEMAREANTIGAKCQDADLSPLVVALKAEVERLREQAQNVE